ncbi:hypothetical protein B0H13DRAFT_2544623 [Mycena leptocephala]|nr:hypothetical protein B0H13DRAFT_2544623 [Mycena leptocephala]
MSSTLPLTFGSPGLTSVENQVKSLIAVTEANIERLTARIRELTSMRETERNVLATLRLMVKFSKHAVHIPAMDSEDHAVGLQYYCSGNLFEHESHVALRKVLCLSQVSSYWRQIIHNAPQLWAEGVVPAIRLRKDPTDRYLDGLETFLARSNPFPITVSLTPWIYQGLAWSESSKNVARIVASTAHRWKNLKIDLDSFLHFNDLLPATFEALECLLIYNFWSHTDPVLAFQFSPRLRKFSYRNNYYNETSKIHLFHLPWSQLTHLEVEDRSLGRCRRVLLQCTNLVWAKVNTSTQWDSSEAATDSPVHGVEAFLVALTLPSLKSLDIEFDDETPWTTQVFSEFQSRSPNIDKITLTFSSIDSRGLIALLRHSPALRTLELQACYNCVDDDFFEALRYEEADSAPLAPKLQNMHFKTVGLNFEEDLFEVAIRSRWWKDGERLLSNGSPPRVTRLDRVFVQRTPSTFVEPVLFGDDIKARMQELVDQGLDIELV